MFPPVDYPVPDKTEPDSGPTTPTYATLLDRHEGQQPITTSMIQAARAQLEAAHQLPEAPKVSFVDAPPAQPVMQRLMKVIR
ncbi:MAG: hypothetical protein AB8B84_06590 [Granulosicoccus sp.]